ncbi:methyltransferase [Eubacteriales bacterium OttesenSCG-928-M02]|nr:methyltransferase [Eubacteriales bacterium OttesenSCG-928-M02]
MLETTVNTSRWSRPGERLDDLQLDGLYILQDPGAFCFGTDSVLLADFCRAKAADRVLDLGTGNGILPLLLWGRYRTGSITGIEIQERMADLAARNFRMNHLPETIYCIKGDYRAAREEIPANGFSLVVMNPPYYPLGGGKQAEMGEKALARHEVAATLAQSIAAAKRALQSMGRLCMVYPTKRLAELFGTLLEQNMTPKRLRLVQERVDKPADLALLEAVKGGGMELRAEPTLVLKAPDGSPTAEYNRIFFKS